MAKRRRREQAEQSNVSGWLVTYTDLCMLLLTFFVLLVSMSSFDGGRKKNAIESLANSLPTISTAPVAEEYRLSRWFSRKNSLPKRPPTEFEVMSNAARDAGLGSQPITEAKNGVILMSLEQSVLFQAGTFNLSPESRQFLATIVPLLKKTEKEIEIRGHADIHEGANEPFRLERLWDLSAKRATAIYDYLTDQGVSPGRMKSYGFGYQRPVEDSISNPDLSEKNRRVEIIVSPSPSHFLPAGTARSRNGENVNYKNFFNGLFPDGSEGSKP